VEFTIGGGIEPASAAATDHEVAFWGRHVVVFAAVDELYVLLVGDGEFAEIPLSGALEKLAAALHRVCGKKAGLGEAAVTDNYANIALMLSNMFAGGEVGVTDPDVLLKMQKRANIS